MKTIVFTFSGTGNSLQVARDLCLQLKNVHVIPISQVLGEPPDLSDADRVGIITPVYDFGLPRMVEHFLDDLAVPESSYCFGIVTYSRQPGNALLDLQRILEQKKGGKLDYGQAVKMVHNRQSIPGIEKRQSILLRSDEKIRKICYDIKERRKNTVAGLYNPIFKMIHNRSMQNIRNTDQFFSVHEVCTGCGRCSQLCPADNIRIKEDKPVFEHRCEGCLACVNWCPVKAITISSQKKQGRYRNPKITVDELIPENDTHQTNPGTAPAQSSL